MNRIKRLVVLVMLAVPVWAHAATLPQSAPMQSAQPPAQETLQQPFSIVRGTPFRMRFAATAPGPVYIDLSWRGVPLEVRLQGDNVPQAAAVQSGAGPLLRLIYTITPADVQRGYFWSATVYVPTGYRLDAGNAVLAQGTARAVYPKPDQRLLAAQPGGNTPMQQSAPQLQGPMQEKGGTAFAAERMQYVPLRYAPPRLAGITGGKALPRNSLNLNQKITPASSRQIPFRPFTMEEVFDLQTGKPLFAHNIDERTGELLLPQHLRTPVAPGRLPGVQELQQKGFNAVQLKTPGAVRFGKIGAGPLSLKSKINIPRRDGMVSEAEVEDYLRELNDFEKQLNAVGQTLRDPQSGRIKTRAEVVTVGKLQRNETLLQQQLQKTANLLDKRVSYRPWTATEIKGMEQKAVTGTPKRLLAPRNTWKDLPPGLNRVLPGVMLPHAGVLGGAGAYPDCYLSGVTPARGVAGMEVVLDGRNLAGCEVSLQPSAGGALQPVAVTPVDGNRVKIRIPAVPEGQVKLSARKPAGIQQQTAGPAVSRGGLQIMPQTAASPAPQNSVAFEVIRNVYAQPASQSAGQQSGQQGGVEPPPDYFSRDLQPFKRSLVWGESFGDPAGFATSLKTEFSIYSDGYADDNLVRFKGYGGAIGTLFNYDVEIIAAKGNISIPTGNTRNDNDLRANFIITAGGQDIYKWGKTKNQQTGAEQGECPAEERDGSGKCCSKRDSRGACTDDGFVTQVRFEYQKHYQLAKVDYYAETNFTLGPVPMTARFGFRGEAGADMQAVVSPLQVIGKVTPYINTSIYGECAVDLWFAEGGVGANMTMLNMQLDAAGQAYINFGTLKFDVDAYVFLRYDSLSGYAYAYVDAFGSRWVWDIARWNGFKGELYLLPVQKLSFPLFPGV